MTNDIVSVTIYGQEELIHPCLLPYISKFALTSDTPLYDNEYDEIDPVEKELGNAQVRYLLREDIAESLAHALLCARSLYSSDEELTFELGWLACKLNLFTPVGF